MAYGAGIVWIVEPLLARMISGPKATPAGIPAGDPRIGPGSKCNAVRHSFPPAFCVRAKPNTEQSKSPASNPIGTEKRHSVGVSCAGPRAGGGRRTGHDRRAPVEDRSRAAEEGIPTIAGVGFPTPLDQEHGFNRCSILDSLEQSGGSRCYPILEAPEGSVDWVHVFRRPLLSSRERPSLQAPLRSRHPTLRHRRLTRTRRDRSRYPGQMSHRWLTTRRRAVTPRNYWSRFQSCSRAYRPAAAAARADQPPAPIEHSHIGAVPSSHLGRPGLSSTISDLAVRWCLLFRACWWCRRA